MLLYPFRVYTIANKEIRISAIRQVGTHSAPKSWSKIKKTVYGVLGFLAGGTGVLIFSLNNSVKASIPELHPPKYNWDHYGYFTSLDHSSVRRGYEVFKQTCSACHSLCYVAYRDLVGVSHTEAEAKAEAEEQMIVDGPNELGYMFERPGKLSDRIPPPYPNEQAARAANNGAYPPDLTHIILAREEQEDYIFSLLTGYCDPPAGITLKEGQNYNPYFIGGAISMAQPLFNDSVSYSDDTPAYMSQLAKDVTVFLKWAGEPEFDDRKRMMIKAVIAFSALWGLIFYLLRMRWMSLKTRKIQYRPK